ncbi:MAG: PilZ domain-containing protein [Candidatus Omnitrophica bacterium]|nr:PilZ domain-containing protein [Candidatus Omnitrophota bacterium]
MFDSNRRKYPRIYYPCQLMMWLDDGSNETIMANTTNIGIGGLSVTLNQKANLGTKVDIQLNFSNPATSFRCKGAVVSCLPGENKIYNTGIRFEPLDEIKAVFLERKISELLRLTQKGNN